MQVTLYTVLAIVPALVAAQTNSLQVGTWPAISGYTQLGCYDEPAGARALQGAVTADTANMTIEACATFCSGYAYFGTEYSIECYCGNTLLGGALDNNTANCDLTCVGNPAENCGGHGTLNLYQSNTNNPTPPPITPVIAIPPPVAGPYTLTQCLTDGVNGTRALQGLTTAGPGMTNEVCAAFCAAYVYFGTEYGSECYCGNTIIGPNTPTVASACNMPCSGAPGEICGGNGAMLFYERPVSAASSIAAFLPSSTAPVVVIPSSAAAIIASSSSTLSSTFTTSTLAVVVASSSSFRSSSAIGTPTVTPAWVATSTSVIKSSSSFKTSTISRTSTSAAGITAAPLAFNYVGCFTDVKKPHNMVAITTAKTMNPSICIAAAKAALTAVNPVTYHYIGVEAGSECYGATAAPLKPTSLTGVKACTSTCVGGSKPAQTCGGKLQYNLYASVSGSAFSGAVVTKKA